MRNDTARAEARARGASRYVTGLPCKLGHLTERYVSNGICVECKAIKNRRSPKEAAV